MTDMKRIALLELIYQRALQVSDTNLTSETVAAILDAVEPLIRADERQKYGVGSIEEILHDERERIAQAIEAMPNEWIAAVGVAVVRAYAAQIARNGGRDE